MLKVIKYSWVYKALNREFSAQLTHFAQHTIRFSQRDLYNGRGFYVMFIDL